jgi:Uma2 family endonuclease
MADAATISNVSLERFLNDPELESYEYLDGEIRDSVVGTPKHATIQTLIAVTLFVHLRKIGRGWAMTEARCRLPLQGRTRFYLPDVCVVLNEPDALEKRHLEKAPELIVEILSPEDSLARLLRKIDDFVEAGSQLAWIILPSERAVLVCRPDEQPQRLEADQIITGEPVLPDFSALVRDFFE